MTPDKTNPQTSLADRVVDFTMRQPDWLRSALFGGALIYLYAFSKAGSIGLPILAVVLFFTNRSFLLPAFLAILVLAPLGGFLGGLVYGISGPLERRLGKFGRWLRFVLGAWIYATILVFLVVPVLDPSKLRSLPATWDWIATGIIALVFGSVLAAEG